MSSRRGIKWGLAKPERCDGHQFASKKEARRYRELKLRERAGDLFDLEVQPVFPIEMVCQVNGEVIGCGVYRADFRYRERRHGEWVSVVEDVKGGPTTGIFRLKKRLVEAAYKIQIVEVR